VAATEIIATGRKTAIMTRMNHNAPPRTATAGSGSSTTKKTTVAASHRSESTTAITSIAVTRSLRGLS